MSPAGPGQPHAIAILGPTGAGKSALAMRIARDLPVEIISVDSAQVYRGLDIGTAKPTPAERAAVAHHLIDIRDVAQVYSAGEFRADALRLLDAIVARGRVPLLVGGTMLYFRALFRGIAELPTADMAVRARLDERGRREGWPALHAELLHQDPVAGARISPNDSQRIQRALEVLELSGRPLHAHWEEDGGGWRGAWQIVLLEPASRAALHQQLALRLEAMLAAGLVEETRRLLADPAVTGESPVLRMVGYRQLARYCRGQETLQEASRHALEATRQLAKRQLTWLRSATLLPNGATTRTMDPFDVQARERLALTLIKAKVPS